MTHWIRFEHQGSAAFGVLEDDGITVYEGDMFAAPTATGKTLALGGVKVPTPTAPTKMIALCNNFHAVAEKIDSALFRNCAGIVWNCLELSGIVPGIAELRIAHSGHAG